MVVKKWKMDFLAAIAWHYLWQEGRRKDLFWPKHFGVPKTVKTKKHYKNSGFKGNCPKPKMTPFLLKKVFFDMGQKVGFTNCVFETLCSSENTIL